MKLIAALGLAASIVLGVAGVAGAQNYAPPGITEVSPANPGPGSTVTLSGTGVPGETVTVELVDGEDAAELISTAVARTIQLAAIRTLGSTTVADDGTWSITVTIPTDVVPPALLRVVGSVSGAFATIVILPAQTTTTVGPDDMASTGADTDLMVPFAVGLLVAGGLLVLAVRQRRRDRIPTGT